VATFTPTKVPKPIEIDKFLGLNESVGDTEVAPGEAVYMRNFRITSNNKLEKRSGHTTFIDESQPTKLIRGMWYGRFGTDMVLIYACNGNVKKKVMPAGATTTLGTLTDADTNMFYFGGKLFFLNGTDYKYYDGTTFGTVASIAYVPTIAINAPPTGGGTLFEEVNNLTGKKKQTFLSPGAITTYQLAETAIDATLLIITVNGVTKTETTDFTVNRTTGVVTFTVAPAANVQVVIQWEKASTSNPAMITANRAATIFGPGNDTTVFIWGDPANKNRRTFSGTLDATYWPVNNYTLIGSDEYAITDMQPQYDRLIIFKEVESFYSVPEYNATLQQYDYPVYNLNYSIGNVPFNGVQVVRNNPVSLYSRTIWEWVSTQVKDERNATDRGERLNVSFGEVDFSTAKTFDYQAKQELWINVGNIVYIWNYDNDTLYVYDNIEANCFIEIDGVVYYGTKTGKIERFDGALSDNGTAISAIWKSGFVDFGSYEYLKTSRDMWFSIQPASRTSVSIKCPTNRKNEFDPTIKTFKKGYVLFDFEDIDFEEFSFETNRNPQPFRIKIKAKKYAFIQFVFENAEVDESLVFLSFKVACETGSFTK